MTELATLDQPAVTRRRSSRVRRRLVAAGAFVVAAAVALTVTLSVGGHSVGLGPTAFAFTPTANGYVSIRVVSTQASAQQMTNQLHARGLNITIETLPASAQLVGTWVEIATSTDTPASINAEIANQAIGHATSIEIPAHFTGQLTADIARAPLPGETITVGGIRNALAPGGPLACHSLSGTTPSTARRVLAQLGYTITGWSDSPSDTATTPAPPAGTRVVQAFIDDVPVNDATTIDPSRSHDVIVDVTAPDDPTYQTRLHSGFAPDQALTTC